MQGQSGSTTGQTAHEYPLPPNLVDKTADQNATHCWSPRSFGIVWGQPEVEVKLFRHALSCLLPSNLVGITPDQNVMHRWGQRSCMGNKIGQQEANCPETPKATKCGQCCFKLPEENMNICKEHDCLFCCRAFNAHRCSR